MPTNKTTIGGAPPFAGIIALNTASFYRLDPTGRVPIEPIADIVPSVTPFRVALDIVDQETHEEVYEVTRNVLQDFTDTTPNVHRAPVRLTVTGTLTATGPLLPGGLGQLPTFGFRFDLLRMAQLESMAQQRRPIMVVTPRVSLATAFVARLARPWSPSDGESTVVTVDLVEARIVGPANAEAVLDTDAMAAGDVQATSGGATGGTATDPSVAQEPPVEQVPPVYDSVGGTP